MKVYGIYTYDDCHTYGIERVFISRELAEQYLVARKQADGHFTDAAVDEMTVEESVPGRFVWHTCRWSSQDGLREHSGSMWEDEERYWYHATDPFVRYNKRLHPVPANEISATSTNLDTARKALSDARDRVQRLGWPEDEAANA